MGKLVIVESPAKAKTIKKYLGSGYNVIASMGHVRDLPKSTLGVDIDNNFEPKYISIKGKGPLIKELKKAAAKSDKVFLATDPDREGEAISWHLAHLLNLKEDDSARVTFNEITKSGVKAGMKEPRKIDYNLVNSQQARRILDRIVGYKLSPFLWAKVRRGLSAGRVQSVALKMIVDKEKEIRDFKSEEYWSIEAFLKKHGKATTFKSSFYGDESGKIKIENAEQADKIFSEIDGKPFTVQTIKKGTRQKSPSPPFTTSTLQQEASRKLSFPPVKTMRIAQELYDGVDVKGIGSIGLITYMRTDSMRISKEASDAALDYIKESFGDKYLPETTRVYKAKREAQDAHEAIRPTTPGLAPDQIKESLTNDQFKLYNLVWKRFMASQMSNCVQDTKRADIRADKYIFKVSGYTVAFDGFTVLYDTNTDTEENVKLPDIKEGETLDVDSLDRNQHFTQPPARYTEATLIKALEEEGIGRPSTFASTIGTVMNRDYVEKQQKYLHPTELGEIINKIMEDNFSDIVNLKFTAKMEDLLDNIAEGSVDWHNMMANFYAGFEVAMEQAEKNMEGVKIKIPEEETDEICEKCGRHMVIKMGRYGKFLACPGYPECKNAKPLVVKTKGICPKCGGTILVKKSKKGKPYYGCEHNPTCDFMTWDEPTEEKCPKCGKTLLKKKGKNAKIYCSNELCDYERQVVDDKK